MAKNSGTTRLRMSGTHSAQVPPEVDGFIKAYTAKGGPDYRFFSQFYNTENAEKTKKWMDDQPKLDGVSVFRGSQMLSGDIVNFIVYEGWKAGETIIPTELISGNPSGILAFSKQSTRVLSYGGTTPKPKPEYDRFENEPITVKFEVETSGVNFVDIARLSHYPEEQEAVAKKNARFKYIGAEYKDIGSYWLIKLKEVR